MKETIYTIPVNDAYNSDLECPLCQLRKRCEDNEIEYYLGPSLMEPDTRKITNNNLGKVKPSHIWITDITRGKMADKTNTTPCSHRLNTTDICLYVRPPNLPNSMRNATHNANGRKARFTHRNLLIHFSPTLVNSLLFGSKITPFLAIILICHFKEVYRELLVRINVFY